MNAYKRLHDVQIEVRERVRGGAMQDVITHVWWGVQRALGAQDDAQYVYAANVVEDMALGKRR